ncbi:DUF721 domain-containing protein [bacterium]|nr:DUF721 domain-containing protein [bacterium]
MSKVLYTDFEPVDDILSAFMTNPNLKKAIAKTTLYNFWDGILPEKYKKMSKPFGMLPGKIMVIACKNPIVAQELTLRKSMLLAKFQPYLNKLNLNVEDFKFDAKKWNLISD